jgi:hypothetical protein
MLHPFQCGAKDLEEGGGQIYHGGRPIAAMRVAAGALPCFLGGGAQVSSSQIHHIPSTRKQTSSLLSASLLIWGEFSSVGGLALCIRRPG